MLASEDDVVAYVELHYPAVHHAVVAMGIPQEAAICCSVSLSTMIVKTMTEELGLPEIENLTTMGQAIVVVDLLRRGTDAMAAGAIDDLLADVFESPPGEHGHA